MAHDFVVLPMVASFLNLDDLVAVVQASKVWRDLLHSSTFPTYALTRGLVGEKKRIHMRRRGKFLKNFKGIRNLSISEVNWYAEWVAECSEVFRNLHVLVVDHLFFKDNSEPMFNVFRPTETGSVSSGLVQLSLSRILGVTWYNMFHNVLLPVHPLQHLSLDMVMYLNDQDVRLIFSQYPQLQGLHITAAFLITEVVVPAASARVLQELTVCKCVHLTLVEIPAGAALTFLDCSFSPLSPGVLSGLVAGLPKLETLVANQFLKGSASTARALNLSSLSLATLQASNSPLLQELRLQCDNLHHVMVAQNFSLRVLTLQSWQIVALDLSMLKELRHVQLHCPRLRKLLLCGCQRLFEGHDNEDASEDAVDGAGRAGCCCCPLISSLGNPHNHGDQRPSQWEARRQELVDQVGHLLRRCPLLDVEHFLDWGIGGTPLFALKDDLHAVFVDRQGGMYRSQLHLTDSLHSPHRPGELRKRSSFS